MSNYRFSSVIKETYSRNVSYFLETLVSDYGWREMGGMEIEIAPNLEVRLLKIPGISEPQSIQIKNLISGALANLMMSLEDDNGNTSVKFLGADELQISLMDYIQYVIANNPQSNGYKPQKDFNNFLIIFSRDFQLQKLTPEYADQILNLDIKNLNLKTQEEVTKWINQINFYAEVGSKLPLGITTLTGELLGLFIIHNLCDDILDYDIELLLTRDSSEYSDLDIRVVRIMENWLEKYYPDKKLNNK